MRTFLQDFDAGVKERRYAADSLPSLGFAGREFNLASIREMCRVAGEYG
jgi:hypothetical protein